MRIDSINIIRFPSAFRGADGKYMQNVLSLVKSFIAEMGGRLAPEAKVEEDIYFVPPAAIIPASSGFYEIPSKPGGHYGLQLFLSGVSRTYLVGEIHAGDDLRPVHYASVATALLHRFDGRMSPFSRPLITDLLMLDLTGFKNSEIVSRYNESIEIIDCAPKNSDTGYQGRRLKAVMESSRVQHEMQEEELLLSSGSREEGVLIVIDGSLAGIEGASKIPGAVGLVPAEASIMGSKSEVLDCPFMARSALNTKNNPASFYMRLRDHSGNNPDFGLIRVELGLKPDGSAPDEEWASDVASLLISERFPVDPNIKGWDKKIYALLHTGHYIDTLLPPASVVTTYFGRSTA